MSEQAHHEETGGRLVLSDAFMEHALTPRNLGVLPEPAAMGQAKGTCGDLMEMYLRVEDGAVVTARFLPHGCMHTVACGSVLTGQLEGLTLEQALSITPDQVEEDLGGLPREHRHCAALAVAALRAAVREHYQDRRSPWKRLYQRD